MIAALPAGRSAAEPIFPGSSAVGLEPPPGMASAPDFVGFKKGIASILISELPSSTFAGLEANKGRIEALVQNPTERDLSIKGARSFLITGEQTGTMESGPVKFRKWLLVIGASEATEMVTVQIPVEDTSITDAEVEAALHSIVLRKPPDLATQVAALPFTIGDREGFRPLKVIAGAVLLLTKGPLEIDPTFEQSRVIVSTSLGSAPPPPDERRAFLRQQLDLLKVANPTILEQTLYKVGDAEWGRITATSTDAGTGKPSYVALYIRFETTLFITVFATVPLELRGFDADKIRMLAESIAPK